MRRIVRARSLVALVAVLGVVGLLAPPAFAAADTLFGSLVVPPVGSGSLKASATSGLTTTLAGYNEGATGPGHCDSEPLPSP